MPAIQHPDHRMPRRRALHACLGALACLALSATGAAHAGNGPAGYPQKPVTLIVPFAPGGGSDNIARIVAHRLGERLGAAIVVDNRPGGGTNIGNQAAARARADGLTLLFGQVTLSINPHVWRNLPYSVEKDFVPVAQIATTPSVLLVNAQSPFASLGQFTAHARQNPGKVNYGSGGAGTSVHLAGHLFGNIAGVQMTHVPYRGSSPAIVDLMGGQIQAMFDTAASALPQLAGGKLRALAVTGAQRLAALPDVPTFAQAGQPGFDAPAWYGVLTPAGTPAPVVQYLNEQINLVLQEDGVQKKLRDLGSEPTPGTPQQFADFMRQQSKHWAAAVKSANIALD